MAFDCTKVYSHRYDCFACLIAKEVRMTLSILQIIRFTVNTVKGRYEER